MGINPELLKLQSQANLIRSASFAKTTADKTERVPDARTTVVSPRSTAASVQQGVRIAFFFDGTGNNLDADVGTGEHSNVARLFRAHPENDPALGLFAYYIPGIGTYFKDIKDPGGTTLGLAFAAKGQARLDWAMSRLDECLVQCKGRPVHVALFGFSRGAALARAFARLVAERCERASDGVWRIAHKNTQTPLRLYFMGLFDTVASVGLPMGVNNPQSLDMTAKLINLKEALQHRHRYGSTLDDIAFADGGTPGADPSWGPNDGHSSWADDLSIPDMMEDCLHMVAAHEIRNSFPVDSVLHGLRYPRSCRERVYPGAHSDVGGGYRRGEGSRSTQPGSALSLIPLRHMRAEAIAAGVPLLAQMRSENLKSDFAEDPASKAGFETLCRRFDLYMKAMGLSEAPVGDLMLAHMKLYHQWRFHRIALNQSARGSYQPTQDTKVFFEPDNEPTWQREKNALKNVVHSAELRAVEQELRVRKLNVARVWATAEGKALFDSETRLAEQLANQHLREKARLDTLPGTDLTFLDNVRLYDNQLLDDARRLQAFTKKKGRNNLRPHYKALLEAYEAEYDRKQGFRNEELHAFFDTYVHDSLAGFGTDATLPSDPRVIYIGKDRKLPFAMSLPRSGALATALG